MILLIAEIFSLLSSLSLIIGSIQKTHKRIIVLSMVESILVIISESLFGATAGILTYPQASPWDSLFLLKPNGFT